MEIFRVWNETKFFDFRVTLLPEKRPELNLAAYRSRAPGLASIIDQFAKKYSGLDIPYPKDVQNFAKLAEEKRSKLESDSKSIVSESNKRLESHKVQVKTRRPINILKHLKNLNLRIKFQDLNWKNKFRLETWNFRFDFKLED